MAIPIATDNHTISAQSDLTLDPSLVSGQSRGVETPASRPMQIGAVAYLNTKPLIFGLQDRLGHSGSLHLALPSRLAASLQQRVIDIGLIPVVEYLRQRSTYRIVSDAVIACRGPVWSVRILFRKDPCDVRILAVDEGSRSSVALASLLFHSRFGRIPEQVEFPILAQPGDSSADAVLVIGDRAMRPERYRDAFLTDWDLGQEWFVETGLPFVFAMWTARDASFATHEVSNLFETSRDDGCKHVEEIVARHADDYGLTPEQCREYLTRYLRFRFASDERAGLMEFSNRCQSLGLV
jgi:chorismate dehydratase